MKVANHKRKNCQQVILSIKEKGKIMATDKLQKESIEKTIRELFYGLELDPLRPVRFNSQGKLESTVTGESVKKVFTDAQLKASPTTPLSIVDAADVNKFIVFHKGLVVLDRDFGEYGNVSADASAGFFMGNFPVSTVALEASNDAISFLLTDAPNTRLMIHFNQNHLVDAALPAIMPQKAIAFNNVGLTFKFINAAGNFTDGNNFNTLTVIAFYTIIDFS
jgi:hypothetical protein